MGALAIPPPQTWGSQGWRLPRGAMAPRNRRNGCPKHNMQIFVIVRRLPMNAAVCASDPSNRDPRACTRMATCPADTHNCLARVAMPAGLFEAGPWDNAAAVDGAHIFSKKRKLLYGDEHNDAAHNEDGAGFAPKELPGF